MMDNGPASASGIPADWERATERPHAVIVSDNPDLREFLGQGLLFAGFWTSVIASGIQVIEVFRLRRFDLIILDGKLDGLSALDVLARLRSPVTPGGPPVTDAPLAVIAPAAADRGALVEKGADLLIDPPLELAELAGTLRQLVLRWRAERPDVPWSDAPKPQAGRERGGGSVSGEGTPTGR